jgi:hypothetical protein
LVGAALAAVRTLVAAAGNPAPLRPSLPHRRADPGGSTALVAARNFNQGQATVEYVASALIDLDIHVQSATDATFDIGGFEQAALARMGMLAEID